MEVSAMRMARARERAVILLLLLVIAFVGCKPAERAVDLAVVMREANTLLQESNKSTEAWTSEYGKAFTPQNRAQFPANRESLRAHADNITKLLDENATQCNKAIEKYEQAIALMKDEKQRRGSTLIVSALRKSMEIYVVIKSQMQLLSDEQIVSEKAFNEKFLEKLKQVGQMEVERKLRFDEGRRLLGM
jgi:hypothetical protein